MKDNNLFKAASGLSGGIGWMHDTCGSLLGASLILGLKYGRGCEEIDNVEKLISSGEKVGKIYKWFEKEFGTTKCREIRTIFSGGVYYNLIIPMQAELAKEAGVLDPCPQLIAKTAAKAAEMLLENM